jgi:hypothetical protein
MIPKKLLEEINRWIDEKRYGNLQINFSGGKIVNVNRTESIKVDMLINTQNGTISISESGTSFA